MVGYNREAVPASFEQVLQAGGDALNFVVDLVNQPTSKVMASVI